MSNRFVAVLRKIILHLFAVYNHTTVKASTKAPPVYKPTSQRVFGPHVYRPPEAEKPGVQLKPANHFRTETRPAPPVFRPQQANNSNMPQKSTMNFRTELRGSPRMKAAEPNAQIQRSTSAVPSRDSLGSKPFALAPCGSSTIQMAKDEYKKPVGQSYKKKDTRTARQKAKAGVTGGAAEPNYKPTKDSAGNKIWDGSRSSLKFSSAIESAMAATAGGGCQIRKAGCTGNADAIDHIAPFSEVQSAFDRYVICDGTHHWSAVYKVDADSGYNNGDDPKGFQWSCTSCNSKKNGTKGVDKNTSKWKGACPGECGYAFQGDPAED